jgi:asparagine synthase (glutamine-hydrolysing)
MCGIVAALSLDQPLDPETIRKATTLLTHRGPDHSAIWLSPSRRVGLGYRRLSIIDIAGGNQPLSDEFGERYLVANCEFYGFEAQRRKLSSAGHMLTTQGDAEIAIHLYEDWGIDCLARLIGEFAFILWDEGQQRLFAARDRLGVRPLYYTRCGGVLYLASEIKSLLALGAPAAWDVEAYYSACHLAGIAGLPERTFFRGIYQLPPGHFLTVHKDQLCVRQYWDIEFPLVAELDGTPVAPELWVERTRSLVEDAVRTRLRADVPVAFYLSGGLDSSCVSGIAAHRYQQPVEAFSIRFLESGRTEIETAQRTTDWLGGDLHVVEVGPQDIVAHIREAVYHAESPFFNNQGVAKLLLSRIARDAGYKVVLTGDGADEIFAGYPAFMMDMILHHNRPTLPTLNSLTEQGLLHPDAVFEEPHHQSPFAVEQSLGCIPSWMWSFWLTAQPLRGLFCKEFQAAFAGHNVYVALLESLLANQKLRGCEALSISQYLWIKTMLPQYILAYEGDRMDMAHSIESRPPFLDHRLVECAAEIPAAYKIRHGREKYLLREVARPFVTQEVYHRRKAPFAAPPTTTSLDGEVYQLVQDTLRSDGFLQGNPFFDRSRLRAFLDSIPTLSEADRSAVDVPCNLLLTTALLQEVFGLSNAAPLS